MRGGVTRLGRGAVAAGLNPLRQLLATGSD